MDSRWLIFFVFIWVIGGFMGATYDGFTTPTEWASAGYSSGNMTDTLTDVMKHNVAKQETSILGAVSFIVPAGNWASSLANIVIWNFSFVEPYPIVARVLNIFGLVGLFMLFRMMYAVLTGNVTWG